MTQAPAILIGTRHDDATEPPQGPVRAAKHPHQNTARDAHHLGAPGDKDFISTNQVAARFTGSGDQVAR